MEQRSVLTTTLGLGESIIPELRATILIADYAFNAEKQRRRSIAYTSDGRTRMLFIYRFPWLSRGSPSGILIGHSSKI